MPDNHSGLPDWLSSRRYCTVKHLMRLFEVSRPTIDRWCRDNPAFPSKLKLGVPGRGNCSTRFIVADVKTYLAAIEGTTDVQEIET